MALRGLCVACRVRGLDYSCVPYGCGCRGGGPAALALFAFSLCFFDLDDAPPAPDELP